MISGGFILLAIFVVLLLFLVSSGLWFMSCVDPYPTDDTRWVVEKGWIPRYLGFLLMWLALWVSMSGGSVEKNLVELKTYRGTGNKDYVILPNGVTVTNLNERERRAFEPGTKLYTWQYGQSLGLDWSGFYTLMTEKPQLPRLGKIKVVDISELKVIYE